MHKCYVHLGMHTEVYLDLCIFIYNVCLQQAYKCIFQIWECSIDISPKSVLEILKTLNMIYTSVTI